MYSTIAGRRVVVTGASGFVGCQLVTSLLDAGAQVTALIRRLPWTSAAGELPRGLEVVEVDLRHAAGVRRAVARSRPDLVFHLAAAGVSDPFLPIREALRVNLDGTLNLVRAVQGQAPVIVARTPGERTASNVYAASKAAGWAFCQMFVRTEGWQVFGAILFQCYGPGQSSRNVIPAALAAARAGRDFPLSPGEQVRDWIHLSDVVRGLTQLATADLPAGTSVELGTGLGTTLRAVVELLYRLVGTSGQPRPGMLPYRPGEVMRVTADADQAAALIGWRAEIALEDGLRALAAEG